MKNSEQPPGEIRDTLLHCAVYKRWKAFGESVRLDTKEKGIAGQEDGGREKRNTGRKKSCDLPIANINSEKISAKRSQDAIFPVENVDKNNFPIPILAQRTDSSQLAQYTVYTFRLQPRKIMLPVLRT